MIRHLYNDFFRHFFTVLHKNVPVSGYSGKCGFLSAEIEGKIEQQSNILSFVSYDRFLSIDLDLVLPFFWFELILIMIFKPEIFFFPGVPALLIHKKKILMW